MSTGEEEDSSADRPVSARALIGDKQNEQGHMTLLAVSIDPGGLAVQNDVLTGSVCLANRPILEIESALTEELHGLRARLWRGEDSCHPTGQ
jgi:hypothetical protein